MTRDCQLSHGTSVSPVSGDHQRPQLDKIRPVRSAKSKAHGIGGINCPIMGAAVLWRCQPEVNKRAGREFLEMGGAEPSQSPRQRRGTRPHRLRGAGQRPALPERQDLVIRGRPPIVGAPKEEGAQRFEGRRGLAVVAPQPIACEGMGPEGDGGHGAGRGKPGAFFLSCKD